MTYRCLDESAPWAPGIFSLQLDASAGSSGCRGRDSAVALVKITDKPLVQVDPPDGVVTICETSGELGVDVTFTVTTDNGDTPKIPVMIEASDGRFCDRDTTTSRKWYSVQAMCIDLLGCAASELETNGLVWVFDCVFRSSLAMYLVLQEQSTESVCHQGICLLQRQALLEVTMWRKTTGASSG